MIRARRLLCGCAALLVAAVLRAQGTPVPLLPSTPHRVLQVSGDPANYYLIEEDKPLEAACDGPGLLTLTARRAIMSTDPPVATTSIRVAIDDDVKPPLVFRRAREEGAKFVDETRFFPSAPRSIKLAVPGGSHLLKIALGQQTYGVAVALTFTPVAAVARAADPALPPLEPLVRPPPPRELAVEEDAAATPPASATSVPEPPVEPAPPSEPPVEPAPPPEPPPAAIATSAPAAPPAPALGKVAARSRPARRQLGLGIDAGIGLATTFINLGGPSPTLRAGARYLLPWLDRQLSIGLDVGLVRYALFTAPDAPSYLEATNWVLPLQLTVGFAPHIKDWLHLEGGLSGGVAFNYATIDYRALQRDSRGVGGVAALYGEAGVRLGPGIVYGRLQGDAVAASNTIFNHFDYLGSSLLAGYRLVL